MSESQTDGRQTESDVLHARSVLLPELCTINEIHGEYEEEDTCMSYEEEDTYTVESMKSRPCPCIMYKPGI